MPDWVRRVDGRAPGQGRHRHPRGRRRAGDRRARPVQLRHAARLDRPRRPPGMPDRLVFDLDPPDEDERSHFPAIRAGALELGDVLRELGLEPFAMTSGSRGIHVVAPLRRRAHAGGGAPRARSPSASRSGGRTSSPPPGARRSAAAACWSTWPATPTRRRPSRRTPCGRSRARRSRRRWPGRAGGPGAAPAALDARERARPARGARLPVARHRPRRAGAARL